MTTRSIGQNDAENFTVPTSSKRNIDKKKDREQDREKDQSLLREPARGDGNIQNRKDRQHYEDFDYSSINNGNKQDVHHDINNSQRNAGRSDTKQLKGLIRDKQHSIWPYHSYKDINNYHGNKTEPKFYSGIEYL